ncbi:hypothetical protein [Ruminococcus sp.]|uniref:hypothetical protein n=1 Tax=Ruminococcus sp. TaxID=41978 RepID=UPI0025EBB57B|nr:hypothetical protein [Ruminococcus sp.]
MNTLKIESLLAKKYGYKPLASDLSMKYRQYFKDNIPEWLNIDGGSETIYTKNNSPICDGYDRIVIGDYGAFIEFSGSPYSNSFIIKQGQEYRVFDKQYSNGVKYIWLTIDDKSNIKIYFQKKKVLYADYIPRKFYVSVHEVIQL